MRAVWAWVMVVPVQANPVAFACPARCPVAAVRCATGTALSCTPVAVWAPGELTVGDRLGRGRRSLLQHGPITVEDEAVISAGTCAGTHDYNSPDFQLMARPIHIGRKAWVCTEAFIGPGATVPDGLWAHAP